MAPLSAQRVEAAFAYLIRQLQKAVTFDVAFERQSIIQHCMLDIEAEEIIFKNAVLQFLGSDQPFGLINWLAADTLLRSKLGANYMLYNDCIERMLASVVALVVMIHPSDSETIALITGANQGIGFAIAEILSADHGYHVIMSGRREQAVQEAAEQLKKKGLDVESLVLDLGSDQSIDAAVDYVERHYGVLDVLVNNAGIARVSSAATDSRTTFETLLRTNVVGTMSVTEKFLPLLGKSQQTKRVVFVSSGIGSLTSWATPGSETRKFKAPAYAVSKSALNALCLQYATEYEGDATWKFNAGCPGFCSTNLNGFRGVQKPETGAEILCKLATLDNDGPSGTFVNSAGKIPW